MSLAVDISSPPATTADQQKRGLWQQQSYPAIESSFICRSCGLLLHPLPAIEHEKKEKENPYSAPDLAAQIQDAASHYGHRAQTRQPASPYLQEAPHLPPPAGEAAGEGREGAVRR